MSVDVWMLLIGALATWRIGHMLLFENGPFRVFRAGRERLGVRYNDIDDTVVWYRHEITTCLYCLSVWVGAAVALMLWRWPGTVWLCVPFAFSAVSIILDDVIQRVRR